MKIKMYCVFDRKSCAYMHPFFQMATGQALRTFGDTVKDKSTPIGKHPDDYALYYNGTFDDESGEIEAVVPEFVANGSDFVYEGSQGVEYAR
ncbi:MAG: nonstructural protein [Microviridae sp.]|nr:MAG: nonstructural protein [Microviridae sp.]